MLRILRCALSTPLHCRKVGPYPNGRSESGQVLSIVYSRNLVNTDGYIIS